MQCLTKLAVLLLAVEQASSVEVGAAEVHSGHHRHHGHHHHHHHKGHHHHAAAANKTGQHNSSTQAVHPVVAANATGKKELAKNSSAAGSPDASIIGKMRKLEEALAKDGPRQRGILKVNGPLPADFAVRFASGLAAATGCRPEAVKLLSSHPLQGGRVDEVEFEAPRFVTQAAEQQAGDPDSKLARGALRMFLVAREDEGGDEEEQEEAAPKPPAKAEVPVDDKAIDVDTQMPYGNIEPFGREDTAQELTESSIDESNKMVDQLERAEVAEEKRAVFRALTRLRGAAITSFDGVARTQTGNIDEFSKLHKWRSTHPLHHLAEEESDISKWAFPNADF